MAVNAAFFPSPNRAKGSSDEGRLTKMKRLILMRHGEAVRPHAGIEDFDRSLDDEGRSESRRMGLALAEAGYVPDLALVSAARRTLETWAAAAAAFPDDVAVEQGRKFYAASAVTLSIAVTEAADKAGTIMVVGHNPGIHQFAMHLAQQAGAPRLDRFPTGSAAVFGFDGEGRPRFEQSLMARDLRDRAK